MGGLEKQIFLIINFSRSMFLSNLSFYYYKNTKVMNCLTGIQERIWSCFHFITKLPNKWTSLVVVCKEPRTGLWPVIVCLPLGKVAWHIQSSYTRRRILGINLELWWTPGLNRHSKVVCEQSLISAQYWKCNSVEKSMYHFSLLSVLRFHWKCYKKIL